MYFACISFEGTLFQIMISYMQSSIRLHPSLGVPFGLVGKWDVGDDESIKIIKDIWIPGFLPGSFKTVGNLSKKCHSQVS
jgi:hypothetical protein